MKFEFGSLNSKWVASFSTATDFLNEMAGPGYAHIMKGDPKRTKKLREAYKLICKEQGKKFDAGFGDDSQPGAE